MKTTPNHIVIGNQVHFRGSVLPAKWGRAVDLFGITVHLTGSKLYPYVVDLSEEDYTAIMTLAKEL